MDTTIGQEQARQITGTTQSHSHRLATFVIVATGVAILVTGVGLWLLLRSDTPGDDSAEAGFARDMSIHHAQAVEMALIAQERTNDPEIRIMATDIILTQQGQIGQMRGWLDAWGVPPNGKEPPMAWMGHSMEGRMPGMASPADVAQLRELPVPEMERMFLQLMIAHHQAGVMMAQAVLDRSDNSTVEFLANAIVASQQKEIDVMSDMLESMGADPVSTDSADDEHQHG